MLRKYSTDLIVAATGFDTKSIFDFLKSNVLGIVVLVIGIALIMKAMRGDHKSALTIFGIVLIGIFVVGLAAGTNAANLGDWLVDLATGTK